MRIVRFALLVVLSIPFLSASVAQQTPSSSAQAMNLLQQALAALNPGAPTTDVTLSGSAHYIAGSDDETGTAVLKAMGGGASRMDLTLSSGIRSEVHSVDASGSSVGAWSGSDGVQHAISFHNLLTDSSWFFPGLTLTRLVNTTGIVGTYAGQEILNGQSVLHLSFSQPPTNASGPDAAVMQHLSQIEFYLDSTTLLPVALSYAIHPDNNELLDIPVQILFSNYQNVSGVRIPFHVQKLLNGCLTLDLQVQSATLNSGLSANAFSVQIAQ